MAKLTPNIGVFDCAYLVRFIQETVNLGEDHLTEDARAGLFIILDIVGNSLELHNEREIKEMAKRRKGAA